MGYSVNSIGIQGTDTPTQTGFSSVPTVTTNFNYKGEIKECTVHYAPSANGSSNATTYTVTLPFPAANTQPQIFLIRIVDSGTVALGRLVTRVNSNIADLYPSVSTNNWTGSGTKGASFVITYLTT